MPTAMASSKLTTLFSTSPLPCSSFQYCYRSAQSAYAKQCFRDVEMDLTNAISELTLNCLATMFLNRAVIRGIQGNFKDSLQDAYKVIELSPKLAEGYLCASELLKSMGKWSDALQLYDTAMHQVEESVLIRDARMELQKDIDDANVALFRKLPPEIFGTIIGALQYQDRLQCAATCHAWRSYLLTGLPAMWQELEFIRDIPIDIFEFQLINIDPCQVRSVVLGNNCEAPMARRLLKFLTQCFGIEKLDIQAQIDNSKDTIDLLYQALYSNKHSIKRISIRSCLSWVAPTIIDACPSLTHFTFDSTDFYSGTPVARVVQPVYSPNLPVYRSRPSIRRLEFIGTLLDYFDKSFWQQLHCLEHLIIRLTFITPTVFDTLLESLHRYCPNLKTLKMGLFNRPSNVPSTTIIEHSGIGLVELNLLSHSMDMRREHDSLAHLIRKSRNTLQALHARPSNLGGYTSPAIQELHALTHLRDLGLHGATFTDISALGIDLGAIIRNCPRLESLILNNVSVTDTDFATLANHARNLRRFHLITSHESNVAHQTINAFLQAHNLVDLYLQGQRVLDDQGLMILATKHLRLQCLELLGCLTVTEGGMAKFARHCPSSLRRLMVYHVPEVQAQRCIDLVVTSLVDLKEFDWVGHPSDATDREQIIASLENITRKRTCALKARILFGSQERCLFRCVPGQGIVEDKKDILVTRMLRYT